MFVKITQHACTFVFRHTIQMDRKAAIYVKGLTACYWVCSDNGMLGIGVTWFIDHTKIFVCATVIRLTVMKRGHPI